MGHTSLFLCRHYKFLLIIGHFEIILQAMAPTPVLLPGKSHEALGGGNQGPRAWNSNTLATWCEELTHWKSPWCWERLKSLAVWKEADPYPSPSRPLSLFEWKGSSWAEASKAPVKSDIFPMPAPSWKITLESRNVSARLAKGSEEPAPCLWNYRFLSRSGGLL